MSWVVKKGLRGVKNVVFSYSEVEKKVREATSNEPWGASHDLLIEIAKSTHSLENCHDIMEMIWKRISDHGRYWRHAYKSLVLLEFLARAGSEEIVAEIKQRVSGIDSLTRYHYVDDDGHDHGANVRTKAKELATLLRDKESLLKERAEFYSLYAHEFQSAGSTRSLKSLPDLPENDPPPYDFKDASQSSVDSQRSRGGSHKRTPSQPQFTHHRGGSVSKKPQETMEASSPEQKTTFHGDQNLAAPQSTSNHSLNIQTGGTHKRGPSQSSTSTMTSSASPTSPYPSLKVDLRDDDFDPRAYSKTPQASNPSSNSTSTLITPKTSGTGGAKPFGSHVSDDAGVQRKSSLYGKEVLLAQAMSDRSYENLFMQQSDATSLNDAFALETWRAKIKRYGWKDVKKLFGMGDCGVLLCHVIKLILDKKLAIDDVEFQFGHKDVNVESERKALLQWLYMNGLKHEVIKQGVLAEALSFFPNEFSEQIAFNKYLTKMAQSRQYLSINEISAGAFRDGYILVFLREKRTQDNLEVAGIVVPPQYTRVFYCLFSDSGHFDLLDPLTHFDPRSVDIFHQAPESLHEELHNAYKAVTALNSPPESASSLLASEFLAPSPSTPVSPSPASPSKTLWSQNLGSGLVSLDNLKEKKPEPKKSVGRPEIGSDSLASLSNMSKLTVAPAQSPTDQLEPPLIPAPVVSPVLRGGTQEDKLRSVKATMSQTQNSPQVPKFPIYSPHFLQNQPPPQQPQQPIRPYGAPMPLQQPFPQHGYQQVPNLYGQPGYRPSPPPTTANPNFGHHPQQPHDPFADLRK